MGGAELSAFAIVVVSIVGLFYALMLLAALWANGDHLLGIKNALWRLAFEVSERVDQAEQPTESQR